MSHSQIFWRVERAPHRVAPNPLAPWALEGIQRKTRAEAMGVVDDLCFALRAAGIVATRADFHLFCVRMTANEGGDVTVTRLDTLEELNV